MSTRQLSLEAHNLKLDLANGCFVSGYHNDAPRVVMPRPGDPIPHTGGQVSESAVKELKKFLFYETVARVMLATRR
jgi:hypothetical protein